MDIEKLQSLCLSLPGTSEGIKYGDQLCFMDAGKVFCSSNVKELTKVNFKVPDEQFDELCDRPGIKAAPYGGAKFNWVQIADFDVLSNQEWEHYVLQAHEAVKAKLPKKVRETLSGIMNRQ